MNELLIDVKRVGFHLVQMGKNVTALEKSPKWGEIYCQQSKFTAEVNSEKTEFCRHRPNWLLGPVANESLTL